MAIKRIILIMILILCIGIFSVNANSSNMCGETSTYILVDDVLTINGSGVVDDDTGWIDYYDDIDTVIVSEGITELGTRLFDGFEILSSVSLPNTLTTIGIRTFRGCISLEKIVIPDSVTSINTNSFDGCDNLVIYCYSGSYVEQYAIDNAISYKIISGITITFDANGGINAPDNITGKVTDEVVIPLQKPTRTGYVFAGWTTTPFATKPLYQVGDKISTIEDITLYALWLQCNITEASTESKVVIESNIESPNLNLWIAAYKEKRVVAVKQKSVQLVPGSNEIETEIEWDNIDRDEVKVFLWDDNLMPYAVAKRVPLTKPYTVSFIDWDGTVISSQIVLTGNDAIPPASPTRTGYEFLGWSGNYKNIVSDTVLLAEYIDMSKENVFKVYSANVNKNDTITIGVYLGGIVDMCGFDMNLHYDKEVLEVLNINSGFNLDVVANHIEKDNRIRFNYSSNKNRTKSAKIMEIEFKVKDTEKTNAQIELRPASSVVKIDSVQGNIPVDADYNIENGLIKIN